MKKLDPLSGIVLDEIESDAIDLHEHLEIITLVIHIKDADDPIALDVTNDPKILDILTDYFNKDGETDES